MAGDLGVAEDHRLHAAFSIGQSQLGDLRGYIENQLEPHRHISFQDEYRQICEPYEINLDERIWTVPPERMKAAKQHRVPLSDAAVAVLKKVLPLAMARDGDAHPGAPVFPGIRPAIPLSRMVMVFLLRRMGRSEAVHGFRSTFKDWCSEQTAYPNELSEMAMAHTVPDKVEAAYRRGDMRDKRRRLMADWASYCDGKAVGGTQMDRPAKAMAAADR